MKKPQFALGRVRYWWTLTGHRLLVTEHILQAIGDFQGLVLDVGGGRVAPHDQGWSRHVRRIRVDISNRHAPDIMADAGRLPIRDGQVDGVVAFELLEHMPEPAAFVHEATRVLKTGGRLCMSAPFIYPVHGDPHDYHRFTADALRYLCRGLCDVEVRPYGNHWSSSWILLSSQSRWLRIFNPLLRKFGRRTNPRSPSGYLVIARKPMTARGS